VFFFSGSLFFKIDINSFQRDNALYLTKYTWILNRKKPFVGCRRPRIYFVSNDIRCYLIYLRIFSLFGGFLIVISTLRPGQSVFIIERNRWTRNARRNVQRGHRKYDGVCTRQEYRRYFLATCRTVVERGTYEALFFPRYSYSETTSSHKPLQNRILRDVSAPNPIFGEKFTLREIGCEKMRRLRRSSWKKKNSARAWRDAGNGVRKGPLKTWAGLIRMSKRYESYKTVSANDYNAELNTTI